MPKMAWDVLMLLWESKPLKVREMCAAEHVHLVARLPKDRAPGFLQGLKGDVENHWHREPVDTAVLQRVFWTNSCVTSCFP